jgi:hypothetical protein
MYSFKHSFISVATTITTKTDTTTNTTADTNTTAITPAFFSLFSCETRCWCG